MSRLGAFWIHLWWSTAIGVLVVGAIAAIWYPGALFISDGALSLAITLAGTNAVLGPVLTFVVYNPGKPSLRFDLGVIVLLQTVALGYGTLVAYESRPVFIVVVHDHAIVVHANEVTLDPAPAPAFSKLPTTGPLLAYAELPADPAERGELLFQVMAGMGDVETRPAYYLAFEETSRSSIAGARSLGDLLAKHPGRKLPRWLARRDAATVDQLVYLPLRARAEEIALVLNPADGTLAGLIRLKP